MVAIPTERAFLNTVYRILAFLLLMGLAPESMADPGPPPERGLFRDGLYGGKVFLYDTAYIVTSPLRITGRQALFWGGILSVSAILYNNDQAILDSVQDSRDKPGIKWFHDMGEFFEPLGHMGVMNKYYFAGLAVSYGVGSDKGTRIFGEILESHFIAGIGKIAIQSVAGRARPHEGEPSDSWGNDGSTSFPSGHSINIFQLATVLSHHANNTWFTVGAYTIATSVGVQRITSNSHWPSDVLFSAAFGTAIARAVVTLHDDYAGPRPGLVSTVNGTALALTWNF